MREDCFLPGAADEKDAVFAFSLKKEVMPRDRKQTHFLGCIKKADLVAAPWQNSCREMMGGGSFGNVKAVEGVLSLSPSLQWLYNPLKSLLHLHKVLQSLIFSMDAWKLSCRKHYNATHFLTLYIFILCICFVEFIYFSENDYKVLLVHRFYGYKPPWITIAQKASTKIEVKKHEKWIKLVFARIEEQNYGAPRNSKIRSAVGSLQTDTFPLVAWEPHVPLWLAIYGSSEHCPMMWHLPHILGDRTRPLSIRAVVGSWFPPWNSCSQRNK